MLASSVRHSLVRFGGLTLSVIGLGAGIVASAPKPEPPTYVGFVAPMIRRHCAPCHRAGGVGPFTFDTYEDVKRQIELLRVQILSGQMPPNADKSDFGHFPVATSISAEDVVAFQEWIVAKMPRGEGEPPPPTAAPEFGYPGAKVVSVPSVLPIPAEGVQQWRTFEIPGSYSGQTIRAFDIEPDAPKVMRNAVLRIGHVNGTVAGVWAPGYRRWQAPNGKGMAVPEGAKLYVRALYQPSGKPESSGFKIALDSGSARPLRQKHLIHDDFTIKAEASRTLTLIHRIEADTELVSFLPVARFYCGRVKIVLRLPNDEEKLIFETLRWNPYWVGNYQFAEPTKIPAGSQITASFEYNNDENCPMNDGKRPVDVNSGPRLEDEACELFLTFTE